MLIYTKTELQKVELTELLAWYQSKSQKKEAIIQEFYILSLNSSIDLIFDKVLKMFAIQFYPLKIRYGVVRIFLTRIKIIKTAEC